MHVTTSRPASVSAGAGGGGDSPRRSVNFVNFRHAGSPARHGVAGPPSLYRAAMVDPLSLTERLHAEAARLGFVACGVTRAVDDPVPGARLAEWLGEGAHGSMEWMAARADQRRSPASLWPEV